MSRPRAIITQAQVKSILKGAQQAGVPMGIVVKDGQAMFLPLDMMEKPAPASSIDRWRQARDARKKAEADGRARR